MAWVLCCWCWCWARPAVGWLAAPGVALVAGGWLACGPGGASCLWFWGSSSGCLVVGVAPVVVGGVDAVGVWRCCCVAAVGGAGDSVGEGPAGGALGVGAAGDADGKGVVGDALVDGGVLTVGVGPRHSWRRFPWALLAGVLALGPLGIVDADGVVAVIPGGVAVVAVVDAPGCCR